MRIKLDENMPTSVMAALEACGHDVDTVASEGLAGRQDEEVWAAAASSGRFFVTQDLDFSDIRKFAPGTHPGLLLLRLAEPGRLALAQRLRDVIASEDIERWAGCFVVVTDRKVRVRHQAVEIDADLDHGSH